MSSVDFMDLEFNISGVEYWCKGTASADYYYSSGRMYMPNGDPGYPPDEEISDVEVEFEKVFKRNDTDGDFDVPVTDKEELELVKEYAVDYFTYTYDDWE